MEFWDRTMLIDQTHIFDLGTHLQKIVWFWVIFETNKITNERELVFVINIHQVNGFNTHFLHWRYNGERL